MPCLLRLTRLRQQISRLFFCLIHFSPGQFNFPKTTNQLSARIDTGQPNLFIEIRGLTDNAFFFLFRNGKGPNSGSDLSHGADSDKNLLWNMAESS